MKTIRDGANPAVHLTGVALRSIQAERRVCQN